MRSTEASAATLNDILKGEISAVETYVQALDRYGGEPGSAELLKIKDEHIAACNALRRLVHFEGKNPETHSGVWGSWAKAVEGTAQTLGKAAALKALKEGEEHGLREYENALEEDTLDSEAEDFARSVLIPQQKAHLASLDRMIDGLNR